MKTFLSPQEAWEPLPAAEWNADAARHLLHRATWSSPPEETARALKEGLVPALDHFFPKQATAFPKPALIAGLQEDSPGYVRKIKSASAEEKRLLRREARERSQQALQDMSLRWLQQASRPQNAAFEKWLLFLSDIYVVATSKVNNAALIYLHHDILRRAALGSAPDLAKAVSRSPAMIDFLDLQQSKAEAPNENFARELFELFILGEGHYTENDIKEAARAFTGYRQREGKYVFMPKQGDAGSKTIFGHSGRYTGDDVIDLAFKLPAAAAFVPHEMVKFYLTETPLPETYLATLGKAWSEQGFNLRWLARRFFGSRLFFEPEFRSNFIKSPLQFYLGLANDLDLDVVPLARRVLNPLRQTGQILYNPPNVRGWIGGRTWINSTTLDARRQMVQRMFTELDESNLNADEQRQLTAARAAGLTRFTVSPEWLARLLQSVKSDPAQNLIETFLPVKVSPAYRDALQDYLVADTNKDPAARYRNTLITLLQSPEYQLC